MASLNQRKGVLRWLSTTREDRHSDSTLGEPDQEALHIPLASSTRLLQS